MQPSLRSRFVRLCMASFGLAPAACMPPPPPPTFTPAMAAEANARNANAHAALIATITSGAHPMETVPFEKAPKPKGGPGWFCFEKHKRFSRDGASSGCARTLADCRAAVASQGKEWEVGTCQRQAAAVCQYVWGSETDGQHSCFATASDCHPFVMGYVLRQSECGSVE
jgi:hypothetical protein